MENKKLFSTRDLYLASTLVTMKFYMTNVDFQIEGGKQTPVGYFNFEDTPELRSAENKYWQGMLAIEPRAFITNLRGLKAQCTNVYKSPTHDYSQYKRKP